MQGKRNKKAPSIIFLFIIIIIFLKERYEINEATVSCGWTVIGRGDRNCGKGKQYGAYN